MSDLRAVRLAIDRKREENDELMGFESLYDLYQSQFDQRQGNSIWGSIVGGFMGFMFGGVPGMWAGSTAGSEVAKYAVSHDDYKQVQAKLAEDVFKGGKFDREAVQNLKEEELDKAKDLQNAYALEAALKLATTAMSVQQSGGFGEGVAGDGSKTVGQTLAEGAEGEVVDPLFSELSSNLGPIEGAWLGLTQGLTDPNSMVFKSMKHYMMQDMISRSITDPNASLDQLVGKVLGSYMFTEKT